MILNRLGNKTKMASKLEAYFPRHDLYVEPFFGAGGMFFNKAKAKYNILNDKDDDVFNLFEIVVKRKDDLYDMVYKMPIHQSLWMHWRKNKETDPLLKACRFLLLSNFGYMGKSETLRFASSNQKKLLMEYIDLTYKKIWDCEFSCLDAVKLIKSIPTKQDKDAVKIFIYNDPPYLDTTNNYQCGYTESDVVDLFNANASTNYNFAISEFDHPFILEKAKEHNLNIHYIGERLNMKNRRTEILITNYIATQKLF